VDIRAQLVPIDGTPPIDIVKDLTLVGRREECDVRIPHKSVSKMHCVIVRTDGLLLLRDLGSTNGTRVNGQRIRRAALLPNDQIAIAGFKFRVHFGPDEHRPPQDRTQQLDADDVDNLLNKRSQGRRQAGNDSPDIAAHPNKLPDVYPLEDSNQ
jgi:pSer/pThr/pTyr-binding forkhead associated (FHA) protein